MYIETKNLVKTFNGRNVVDGVSLHVEKGQVVGLLGPNGAGKTTSFYMIVGIEKPTTGIITVDGKDITMLPMYKRAAEGIGYLPQEASIFRSMTVEENIRAMLETTNKNRDEIDQIVNSLIDEFNIDNGNLIDAQAEILTAVVKQTNCEYSDIAKYIQEITPITLLTRSTLFTGSGLTMHSELQKEILSSDEVCLLISFTLFSKVVLSLNLSSESLMS